MNEDVCAPGCEEDNGFPDPVMFPDGDDMDSTKIVDDEVEDPADVEFYEDEEENI